MNILRAVAKLKFSELRDSIMHVADPATSEISDEPDFYSVINREAGLYGYVRLLAE